jgi:hypothetical protein
MRVDIPLRFVGRGGQHVSMPKVLMAHRGLPQLAGVIAADGAFHLDAGFNMNESFHCSFKFARKNTLQERGFVMGGLKGQVARQDEMKIGVDAVSRPPGSKSVNLNPIWLAMLGNKMGYLLEKRRI